MIFPVLETFFKQRSIAIEDTLLKQLVTYRHLLQEANRQFNLTAIITDQDIEIKHFIDSLWFPLPANAKTLLDVGSGAGFPGIPLHLFNPHLTTVLLEPNQKKATFLNHVIQTLNLKNIRVVAERAEIWQQHQRERFDIVTARAVANLPTLLELTVPFVSLHGSLVILKGPSAQQEINDSSRAMAMLGVSLQSIENLILPETNDTRSVIYFSKQTITPLKYPRRYALIKSKPL
jgi:16S rRNA (guanine527-N7)-methyltransferase